MSNRRRVTGRPQRYAARAQRRSATVSTGDRGGSWAGTWLPGVLAVAAEAGHLYAAYLTWPTSATAGAYHVAAGALLGLIAAAIVFGGAGRVVLIAGAAVASSGPVLWLGGTLLDASPYQQLPMVAALAVVTCEAALAARLLPAVWQASLHPATSNRPNP